MTRNKSKHLVAAICAECRNKSQTPQTSERRTARRTRVANCVAPRVQVRKRPLVAVQTHCQGRTDYSLVPAVATRFVVPLLRVSHVFRGNKIKSTTLVHVKAPSFSIVTQTTIQVTPLESHAKARIAVAMFIPANSPLVNAPRIGAVGKGRAISNARDGASSVRKTNVAALCRYGELSIGRECYSCR